MEDSGVILELRGVRKSFDGTPVLKQIDLTVRAGEFITLLGSSGCGKTTTLRIIAGLETPDAGQVILEGRDVTAAPPNRRNVNTVFQNYALFPHMTVGENIAYALKLKKVPKDEQKKRVREALELVQLSGFEKRKPSQLSGGQKQRVAIARAMISNPRLLLLDEPLGALDLQLRRQMQIELKRLQKRLGITFIYITHDQEEAINMSDRIAVMHEGVFEQIGAPDEVYDFPLTDYVARFVGSANVLEGTVTEVTQEDGAYRVRLSAENGVIEAFAKEEPVCGRPALAAVRSEHLRIGQNGVPCRVEEISFAGGLLRMSLRTQSGLELIASSHGVRPSRKVGDKVCVDWDYRGAVLVRRSGEKPAESGRAPGESQSGPAQAGRESAYE